MTKPWRVGFRGDMVGVGSRCTALVALLLARAAAAEPAPVTSPRREPATQRAEPSETLTRPRLKRAFTVEYPPGETGLARVVLELVVDREGSVSEARALEGEEPFVAAALAAARGATFEPARRGDQPIPARIRIEVRFTPPEPEPSPAESPAPDSPEPQAPKQPIEIVVLGERAAPARSSLGKSEIRELPGAFGDPFRAIEVLPGVTPIFTGVPFFYVRGSPPGNVGYFLDGVRVPLLFHVALGPSVIHPGLVERVDIYSGGYPARYGRYAGAIVSGETTAPRKELRGEANVRLFDAGALAEAPFADGRGSALVGGRYSYTAAILSLLAPEVTLTYWDYQARLSYALSPDWRVTAFGFGAFDLFRADEEDSSIGTQFHRVDLRLDHTPDAKSKLRIALMGGIDRSAAQNSSSSDGRSEAPELRDHLGGARLEYERQLDGQTKLRAGADVNLDRYRILDIRSVGSDFRSELFYSRDDITTGARADLVWEPERGVVVTPGLRADLYVSGSQRAFALEPRIAAEFEISQSVRLEHAVGLAQQAPSFVVPVPGFSLSDLRNGLQRSLQSSAGILARPGSEFQLSLNLFHNAFFNLTDFLGTVSFGEQISSGGSDDSPGEDMELDRRALGQAYGLEVSIKRPLTKRVGGFLAYTLSRTTRSVGKVRGRPASFDRTHVLHAALSLDLGRGYRIGGRLSSYTGVPAQMRTRGDSLDAAPIGEPTPGAGSTERIMREGPRSPLFYRLDFRFEKRWLIDRRGRYIAFVAEMLNATLNKETPFLDCDSEGCSGEPIGPVSIPSIGAEVFF